VFTELTKHFKKGSVLDSMDETGDVDDVGIITLFVTSKPYIPPGSTTTIAYLINLASRAGVRIALIRIIPVVGHAVTERVCAHGDAAGEVCRGDWTILLAAGGIQYVRHDDDFFPDKID